MKVLFYSDLHLDNWSAFSRTTAAGFNSRFMAQLQVMEGILKYAQNTGCRVVFGGDLFNRRLLVPSDVFHMTYELIAAYDKVTQYYLVGNHDMYTWNPEATILRSWSHLPQVNIITDVTGVFAGGDVDIIMVPHGALIPTRPTTDGYKVLLTHYGVNEARLGPKDFRMKSDLTVKQLKALNYDLIMLGHIHKPQSLTEDIIVMGSPMAHSFHEANEEKYFYVLDCKTKELVAHKTGAPKFLTHEVKTKTQLKKLKLSKTDYHRVNVLSSKITLSDLADHTGYNVIISRVADTWHSVEEPEFLVNRTPHDEVADYYDKYDTDLDKKRLKETSLEIINAY